MLPDHQGGARGSTGWQAVTDVQAIDFLGLRLHDLDAPSAARVIAARDPALPFAYVITPIAQHMVHLAQGDRVWRDSYEKPGCPDGWAGRAGCLRAYLGKCCPGPAAT